MPARLALALRPRPFAGPQVRRPLRAVPPPHPANADVARHRRAGGPEDRALYRCGCGFAFRADVSASVGCPRCGARQAW